MRPLNIKISGFGPYAGHTEIPLDKLGENGLYLITGDTGAGKTTLFDAICYALYGEASGKNRQATMLRSMYADLSTPTAVELTFSHAGKEYYVKRNPDYIRSKERGDGTTTCRASAELHMPDGRVITKTGNVTKAIEELLGIDKDQFTQIVMLAQGDFLKLLTAETKDRIDIFRNIFKTGCYQKLQLELEVKRNSLYGEVSDGRKSVKQYIDGIMVDKDDVLSIEVDKAKADDMTTEDVIDLLDKLTGNDHALKDKLDGQLEGIKKQLEEVNNRIGAAEALENARKSIENAENKLKVEKPELKKLESALDSAREALKDKSGIEAEAVKIESKLGDYDKVDTQHAEISDIRAKNEDTKSKLAKLETSVKTKTSDLDEMKKEQNEIRDSGAEYEKLKNRQDKIRESVDAMKELEGRLGKFDEEQSKLENDREEYRKLDKKFNELKDKYEGMEQTFRDAQAGILAEKLQDGEACPVCGSKVHPHKAKLSDVVPSESELEIAKEDAENARTKRDEAAEKVAGLIKLIENQETELKKDLQKHFETEQIENASSLISGRREEYDKEYEHLDIKIKAEEKNIARKDKLDELIPELEADLARNKEEIGQCKAAISAFETQISEKTGQLGELKKGLTFESKAAAEAARNELRGKADELQTKYNDADKKVNEQKQLIAGLEETVRSQKKTIDESKAVDIEKDRADQKKLNDEHTRIVDEVGKVGTRISTNEEIRTGILKKSGEISDREKKLQWVSALANTASGQLSGKDKIKLETYIQTMYFDRVINRANIRLLIMSGGQYELIRKKEASDAKSQSGLELDVIDHSNGTERSVKTLSGGESFMASLSLALGLSDEVQSTAGGIQVDTMFVDEGFGSLDPDSLDMAYSALTRLAESNRLVGIISHVADLKSRIDKQIVVTKKRTGGSQVELII